MTIDQLIAHFRKQLNECIDGYNEPDPKCAYAAGILHILSVLRRYDGKTLPTQIAAMHTALRHIGNERGWAVGSINET